MIIKFLGILDICAAIFFWIFSFFNFIPEKLILIIGFYLLIKGAVFLISADIASVLDIICAGFIFLSLSFTLPKFVPILITLFLLQKGIFSLLS